MIGGVFLEESRTFFNLNLFYAKCDISVNACFVEKMMLFHKGLFGYYDIFLSKNILTKQKLYARIGIST